jgi:subtilisin family serine protease
MSLGGWEPSDGTDPMSLALDALTAEHGTLFVVAAGNDGPFDGTVSSPAAAASALTVGAVDRGDALADFSSRGPLVNTRAAKPELVAPGVDIVAARAAGTSLGTVVDARYTSLSGTSMAAPHAAPPLSWPSATPAGSPRSSRPRWSVRPTRWPAVTRTSWAPGA